MIVVDTNGFGVTRSTFTADVQPDLHRRLGHGFRVLAKLVVMHAGNNWSPQQGEILITRKGKS